MEARRYMATRLPAACGVCGKTVNATDKWVLGHTLPRWEYPELTWVRANWRHEHAKCSASTGQGEVQRKAFKAGVDAANGGFSRAGGPSQPPLVSKSLSQSQEAPEYEQTDWQQLCADIPWMGEFQQVPPDATPPRYMTGPHPQAVGTYGPQFIEWADANIAIHGRKSTGLRWFQRALAYRLLEHDEAGSLVWRNSIITMARQCGKSFFLRALIMWRITEGEALFGEEQTIISMAHKMSTAQEIARPARRWALARKDDGWEVRLSNGDERITSPAGSRWLLSAATDGAGVGFTLSCIVVDEGWKIARSVVEAADPAMTESESPQLLLISTAGDSTSDLFMTYRQQALDTLLDPTNTLIAEWSASKAYELEDLEGWRMASPLWSDKRMAEIADKLGKMDPLEFEQNYLNRWVEFAPGKADQGHPVFTVQDWQDMSAPLPDGLPAACGVESFYGAQVVVHVEGYANAVQAAAAITARKPESIYIGKGLLIDPAFAPLNAVGKGGQSKAAVHELRRLADEGVLLHDDSPTLTDQVMAARAVPAADGVRIRSMSRLDAVKAAVWAVEGARAVEESPMIF
jgi:hypothetical protein